MTYTIESAETITCEQIEMVNGQYPIYRRYEGGTWEHLMGQSWEPTSPYDEEAKLEALYQQWKAQ